MTSASDIQPRLLRRMTIRTVFETLQQRGPRSRAELTRETGISAPTVSKVVDDLVEQGLIEETAISENMLGRPGKRICIARTRSRVVGVSVTPETTEVFTASLDGEVDQNRVVRIPMSDDFAVWKSQVLSAISQFRNTVELTILGIGISLPGLISRDRHLVLDSPDAPFLQGRSLSEEFEGPTGLKTVAIRQSQALCAAERLFGAARSIQEFVCLDAADGDSVGVYCDGELLTGRNGLAGNFDSLRYWDHDSVGFESRRPNSGSTLGTDAYFLNSFAEINGPLTIEQAFGMYKQGTLNVDLPLDAASTRLARIAVLANTLFNPTTLFIHTRLAQFNKSLFSQIAELTRHSMSAAREEGCEIRSVTADLRSAATAAIVDHLTRSLGPRLSQSAAFN